MSSVCPRIVFRPFKDARSELAYTRRVTIKSIHLFRTEKLTAADTEIPRRVDKCVRRYCELIMM